MQKAIDLAMRIAKDLSKDWTEELEYYNLWNIFRPIYNSDEGLLNKNRIICYIIHAYSPDSLWLNLKKERDQNKTAILNNLDADVQLDIFKNILNNKHESVNISIFSYLEELKDWRWKTVFDYLDHASRISRFASRETDDSKQYEKTAKDGQIQTYKEEVDIETIVKVNKDKGILLKQAYEHRIEANKIIEEIKKDFVATDSAVQSDFNFSFSETSKKKDILSWRSFIQERTDRIELSKK